MYKIKNERSLSNTPSPKFICKCIPYVITSNVGIYLFRHLDFFFNQMAPFCNSSVTFFVLASKDI